MCDFKVAAGANGGGGGKTETKLKSKKWCLAGILRRTNHHFVALVSMFSPTRKERKTCSLLSWIEFSKTMVFISVTTLTTQNVMIQTLRLTLICIEKRKQTFRAPRHQKWRIDSKVRTRHIYIDVRGWSEPVLLVSTTAMREMAKRAFSPTCCWPCDFEKSAKVPFATLAMSHLILFKQAKIFCWFFQANKRACG